MINRLSAHQAVCRLLAATWDPGGLPPSESIPWPDVLGLVRASNVGGVVYGVTRGLNGRVPSDVNHALEQAFYWSVAENARLINQLATVGPALAAAGGPLLLLKGAALASDLYADLGPRLIGDIDLAVGRQRVPACRQALLGLGYRPTFVEPQNGSLLAYSNQEAFEPPVPYRATLELHWHALDVPYYLRRLPMDWFWENSEVRSIAGQPFRVLTPEANLVYLPAHLALHHKFHGLHSYLDMALLIVKNQDWLDWARIVAAARSFELLSALSATLDRLAQWWPSLPIDEPRQMIERVQPSRTDAGLFRLVTAESGSRSMDFYAKVVSLPGFRARIHFVLQNLFPRPAYMERRYRVKARWHLPYWYLYRVLDGSARYARALRGARRLKGPGPRPH